MRECGEMREWGEMREKDGRTGSQPIYLSIYRNMATNVDIYETPGARTFTFEGDRVKDASFEDFMRAKVEGDELAFRLLMLTREPRHTARTPQKAMAKLEGFLMEGELERMTKRLGGLCKGIPPVDVLLDAQEDMIRPSGKSPIKDEIMTGLELWKTWILRHFPKNAALRTKYDAVYNWVLAYITIRDVFTIKTYGWRRCEVCFTQPDEIFLCQGCKMVCYCGVKCQKQAWANGHNEWCKYY